MFPVLWSLLFDRHYTVKKICFLTRGFSTDLLKNDGTGKKTYSSGNLTDNIPLLKVFVKKTEFVDTGSPVINENEFIRWFDRWPRDFQHIR